MRATFITLAIDDGGRSRCPRMDRTLLLGMIQERFVDGSLKRLIGKCLHGSVRWGCVLRTGGGTVQGAVLSPVLGNIYLHHVLDRWFEHGVGEVFDDAGQSCRVSHK